MDVGLHAGKDTDPGERAGGVLPGDEHTASDTLPELYSLHAKPTLLLRLLGNSPKTFLFELDTLCVVVALLGTYGLLKVTGYEPQPAGLLQVIGVVAAATAIHLLLFVRQRLYLSRFVGRSTDEIRRIFNAALLGSLGFSAFAFGVKVNLTRTWVVLAFIGVTLLVSMERLLVREGFRVLRRRGELLRPVVVVGSNCEGRALCEMFDEDPTLGYRVIGLIDDEPVSSEGLPDVLGPVERTLEIVKHWEVNGVVIAATALDLASTNRLVRELTDAGVHVELSSSLRDIASNRLVMRPLGRFPVAYVEPVPRDGWRPMAKRWFDVAMASFALVVTAPVLAIAALAIKLDSPGPVIFRQERVGRDGRRFHVYKLRTMVVDAEARLAEVAHLNEADGPLFKVRRDPRITRVGRFLRKTSIDELPQLLNVLRDEMSMVGPRPALQREVENWDPELRARLRVRPGITGMWQVSGRSDSSFEDYQRLDLYYVDNWSLVTDVTIVLRTIPAVLFGRGAS
jgi:exopolysaccharide biosynthesis polyprenyl glycosylphosphotransferase